MLRPLPEIQVSIPTISFSFFSNFQPVMWIIVAQLFEDYRAYKKNHRQPDQCPGKPNKCACFSIHFGAGEQKLQAVNQKRGGKLVLARMFRMKRRQGSCVAGKFLLCGGQNASRANSAKSSFVFLVDTKIKFIKGFPAHKNVVTLNGPKLRGFSVGFDNLIHGLMPSSRLVLLKKWPPTWEPAPAG